jgi:tellurite methyltransferase
VSQSDRQKWDRKWSAAEGASYDVHRLLVENVGLLTSGEALDVACGHGQNAIWLAQRGYQVLGVDISSVALDSARKEAQLSDLKGRVIFEQVDLDRWRPKAESYDLIAVFRFLDRSLFPYLEAALRSEGLIFYSTRHVGLLHRLPDANREYLLRPGELGLAFPRLTLLQYHEDRENAYLIAHN